MKEIRSSDAIRSAEADDEGLTLYGNPVVFEQVTEIWTPNGSYNEVIHEGALDGCDISDVTLRLEHDETRIPLARTPNTLKLVPGRAGLNMVAVLADTATGKETFEAVKRGDLRNMSFAFTVEKGGDEWDYETNTRHINRIAKIYECSIVSNPAYQGCVVSAEARAEFEEGKRIYQAKKDAMQMVAKILSN